MELVSKEKCSGCMACVEKCPAKCISMVEDHMGNYYPQIEEANCLHCGVCQRVCPELTILSAMRPFDAYAAWSLDDLDRKTSASGGAASVFYRHALDMGYWIAGVKYTKKFHVVHSLSNQMEIVDDFKQSKYVYSESADIYQKVKERLTAGQKVLFISLPCKIAGLLGYFGKKPDNLVTVDLVCHGTPPYRHLMEHIDCVKGKHVPAFLKFRRDNEYVFQLFDENNAMIYSKLGRMDSYLAAFLEGINYRESCYHCSYAKPERISDITVCDFWGLGQETPFDHPYSGAISAVLINTEQGESFFQGCQKYLFTEQRPVDEAIRGNAQLNSPTLYPSCRAEFEKLYQKQGFDAAVISCLGAVMKQEEKKVRKQQMRDALRTTVGIFIKRYRR
ncbi:Coenzyme F420 hydrogenase/dehydrogenase, beta subunit C-terminal domain [Fusibacillus kribbianus]|uniref:Coenzyme F420 hydrogenase/dehydrogenase, beta subunit C-terminal domain n=1 Tax=Fusibacillus kribbianus TaxID=3044208 RepID=A0AAP4BAY6_9FIRM|nr:Coenzyme F420 hydrogenase/dehydrogenase, beta subunit C-terminal domain [Ruminococcus sp. YH-rum2234]MDI9241548.1 Coenzyme F420 hydrogenase/dehydrogenase, beta subunit C-terminal domain [Ruminococcus sp. YH-rum2234]